MGLFSGQFANVVEWEEYRDDLVFWKWSNKEIKKSSKLIIRPGQDAIFMYNGRREGIFTDEGSYDIESDIIPFLSTLKGFKFGFNSGIRAEVLFINTKEFTIRWGTKQAINLPSDRLPGGLPVRALGSFNCKVSDYIAFIDTIAGIKQQYSIDEVKERVLSLLDQLLMKWIVRAGADMFNLQANAYEISKGIREDLDMEMLKIGITITGFSIASFNYPEEVQKMVNKVASQSMVGGINHFQQVSMVEGMAKGHNSGSSVAADMAGIQMGMQMAKQMLESMNESQRDVSGQPYGNQQPPYQSRPSSQQTTQQSTSQQTSPKFCPECGTPTNGAKFCSNCGSKLL